MVRGVYIMNREEHKARDAKEFNAILAQSPETLISIEAFTDKRDRFMQGPNSGLTEPEEPIRRTVESRESGPPLSSESDRQYSQQPNPSRRDVPVQGRPSADHPHETLSHETQEIDRPFPPPGYNSHQYAYPRQDAGEPPHNGQAHARQEQASQRSPVRQREHYRPPPRQLSYLQTSAIDSNSDRRARYDQFPIYADQPRAQRYRTEAGRNMHCQEPIDGEIHARNWGGRFNRNLRADDLGKFNGQTSVESFVSRIATMVNQYGREQVLGVLPLCLTDKASSWYDTLTSDVKERMNYSPDQWIMQLRKRFQKDLSLAEEEMERCMFRFNREDELDLRSYMDEKLRLLRDAGYDVEHQQTHRIWKGLDPILMNSVHWNATMPLEDFFEVVNTQAYAARALWKSQNRDRTRQFRNTSDVQGRYPFRGYPLQSEGNARLPQNFPFKGKPPFTKTVSTYHSPGFQAQSSTIKALPVMSDSANKDLQKSPRPTAQRNTYART